MDYSSSFVDTSLDLNAKPPLQLFSETPVRIMSSFIA